MEQVKAEPVAWMYEYHPKLPETRPGAVEIKRDRTTHKLAKGWTETPLYATPQPAAVDVLVDVMKLCRVYIERKAEDSFNTREDNLLVLIDAALAQIERKPEDGNG